MAGLEPAVLLAYLRFTAVGFNSSLPRLKGYSRGYSVVRMCAGLNHRLTRTRLERHAAMTMRLFPASPLGLSVGECAAPRTCWGIVRGASLWAKRKARST